MEEKKENKKDETEIEKARKLLEEDKQQRLQACAEEIQIILKKYNCQMVPVIQVSAN